MSQARWDGEKDPLCQRCSDREETMSHIFSCTSSDASSTFKKALATYRKSLRKCITSPLIMSAFETILFSLRKGYKVELKANKLHTNDMNELVR